MILQLFFKARMSMSRQRVTLSTLWMSMDKKPPCKQRHESHFLLTEPETIEKSQVSAYLTMTSSMFCKGESTLYLVAKPCPLFHSQKSTYIFIYRNRWTVLREQLHEHSVTERSLLKSSSEYNSTKYNSSKPLVRHKPVETSKDHKGTLAF